MGALLTTTRKDFQCVVTKVSQGKKRVPSAAIIYIEKESIQFKKTKQKNLSKKLGGLLSHRGRFSSLS